MNYRVGNVFKRASLKFRHFLRGDTLVEVMFAIGIFSMVAITIVSVMTSGSSNMQTSLETTMARNEIDTQAEALRFIHQAYLAEKDQEIPEEERYYSRIWEDIVSLAQNNTIDIKTPGYDSESLLHYSPTTCSELYSNTGGIASQRAFIIDTQSIGKNNSVIHIADSATVGDVFKEATVYPRVYYNGLDSSLLSLRGAFNGAEGLYIVGVQDFGETTLSVDGGPDDITKTEKNVAFYDFYIRSCWYGSGKTIPTTISTLIRLYDPNVQITSNLDAMDFVLTYDWNEIQCTNGGETVACPAVQKKIRTADATATFQVMSWDDLVLELPDGLSPVTSPLGWTRDETGLCVSGSYELGLVNTVTLARGMPMATIKAVTRCNYQMNFETSICNAWTAAQRADWCPKTETGGPTGTNLTLPPATMNPTAQIGREFAGWACKQSATSNCKGDTSVHAPGTTVHYGVVSGKPVLYKQFEARYTDLYQYTLNFNANAGSDTVTGMPTPNPMTTGWVAGNTYTFTINGNPTRSGYRFKGWATTASATSPNVSGNSYTITNDASNRKKSVTLYAVWEVYVPDVMWRVVAEMNGDYDTELTTTYTDSTGMRFELPYSAVTLIDIKGNTWSSNDDCRGTCSEIDEFPVYSGYSYYFKMRNYNSSAYSATVKIFKKVNGSFVLQDARLYNYSFDSYLPIFTINTDGTITWHR